MSFPAHAESHQPGTPPAAILLAPGATAVLAAAFGLSAAFVAAGSVGLLGHPMRRGLSLALLIAAVILAWPRGKRLRELWPLGVALAVAAAMVASSLLPLQVLAVAVVLLGASQVRCGPAKAALGLSGEAVMLLALYRTAATSIPAVWMAADALGWTLGRAAGAISGQPLWVGATFGGLDFLVVMIYLTIAALVRTAPRPTRLRLLAQIALGLAAILCLHLDYLEVLSLAPAIWRSLPAPQSVDPMRPFAIPEPTLAQAARDLVPWNMPAIAAAGYVLIAAAILRLGVRSAETPAGAPGSAAAGGSQPFHERRSRRRKRGRYLGPGGRGRVALGSGQPVPGVVMLVSVAVLAAAPPLLTTLYPDRPSLAGKKIVIFEKGFLNWLKPEHGDYGRLTIGMYGMMPTYLESLGAKPLVSPDLSAEDLEGAEAVVLLFPNEPWKPGQLERLWKFVEDGGTLLVMGEHTVREKEGGSRFNDVLKPTAMRVRFDSATFVVGGWLQSYEALAHPTTAGVTDDENDFGVVIGAAVDARWPARPLIVGRWGWADPGDPQSGRAMMGNDKYDPGEQLGDLVLAAEQPLGKGRVIAFGDTSGLTNGLTVGCYDYTSRLYAYLVDPPVGATSWARPALALAAVVLLAALLLWRPDPWRFGVAAALLAASLSFSTWVTHDAWTLLPDGRVKLPNNLAYIDASHMGSYSAESWRQEGLMGVTMTLMRNGYLALNLREMSLERLRRARLLLSVAPARSYTAAERETIRDFVDQGGIFITTVGYEERGPSEKLLADFQFHIGGRPEGIERAGKVARKLKPNPQTNAGWRAESAPGEPRPLGYFKSPYFNSGTYMAYVRFHAAWPVFCDDPRALVVTYAPPDLPVIVIRRYGKGLVVVIGDTYFATNKNLEHEGGEPFEGMRENAVFWRYLLSLLRNGVDEGDVWYPPKPEVERPPGSKG